MRAEETDAVRIVAGVLSGLNDQLSLATLQQQSNSSPVSLLSFAAQLKQIQEEDVSTAAGKVKDIKASELDIWRDSDDTSPPLPRRISRD